jgi:hypothetical protein
VSITNGYATLAELKAALRISDYIDDAALERSVEGASRRIDGVCDRRFYLDATASARIYRATSPWRVDVDDIGTTTGLVVRTDGDGSGTYATTWASTDYELGPLNALAQGRPANQVHAVEVLFPTHVMPSPVQVTARWGWPSVPDAIREATILLAGRMFKRQDSLLGVAGVGDLGALPVMRFDSDIEELVAPYVRRRVL